MGKHSRLPVPKNARPGVMAFRWEKRTERELTLDAGQPILILPAAEDESDENAAANSEWVVVEEPKMHRRGFVPRSYVAEVSSALGNSATVFVGGGETADDDGGAEGGTTAAPKGESGESEGEAKSSAPQKAVMGFGWQANSETEVSVAAGTLVEVLSDVKEASVAGWWLVRVVAAAEGGEDEAQKGGDTATQAVLEGYVPGAYVTLLPENYRLHRNSGEKFAGESKGDDNNNAKKADSRRPSMTASGGLMRSGQYSTAEKDVQKTSTTTTNDSATAEVDEWAVDETGEGYELQDEGSYFWNCDNCGDLIRPSDTSKFGPVFRSGGPARSLKKWVPKDGVDFGLGEDEEDVDTSAPPGSRPDRAGWVPRWNCTVCLDYDLCAACAAKHAAGMLPKPSDSNMETESAAINPHVPDHDLQLEQVVPQVAVKHALSQPHMASVVWTLFDRFKDRWCLGTRAFDPKSPSKLGEYKWRTYAEVGARSSNFGKGLLELGGKSARVGVCGPNCEEWLVTDYGCCMMGLATVPLHITGTHDELRMILEDAQLDIVVCCQDQFSAIARGCRGLDSIKYIVVWDSLNAAGGDPLMANSSGSIANLKMSSSTMLNMSSSAAETLSFSEVEEIGMAHPETPDFVETTDKTVITIIFTSGSTGRPKGVVLDDTYYRRDVCSKWEPDQQPFCMLSFLPLAHATDRYTSIMTLAHGGQLGFSTGDLSLLLEDIQALRPVQFGSTPRFFHMLYADYVNRLDELKASEATLEAAQSKAMAEFRYSIGNRCVGVFTGGAATSQHVLNWMKLCWGHMQMVGDGYGATECGNIASDGVLRKDMKWKIESVPEMGYFTPSRGELCVITPSMFTEYFQNSSQTNDAIDSDGYYHTGDIVWLLPKASDTDPDRIEIIDRRKNFFKMAQGVFVAPDRIENLFVGSLELVEQMFVHGTVESTFLVCIVVPNVPLLQKWYQKEVSEELEKDWITSARCEAHLLKELQRVGQEKGMRSFEIPRHVRIETVRFSAKNRLLTPSEKPCRPKLKQKYSELLESLLSTGTGTEEGDEGDFLVDDLDSSPEAQVRRQVASLLGKICGMNVATLLHRDEAEGGLKLRELCVDSLTAVRVVRAIREHSDENFRAVVPLELIYDPEAKLSSLISYLLKSRQGGDEADDDSVTTRPLSPEELASALMEQVRKLNRAVVKRGDVGAAEAGDRVVFLTGATGFCGAFLAAGLQEARARFGADKIVCLVRGSDNDQAKGRFLRSLHTLGITACDDVEVVAGDLGKPLFGLSEQGFRALARRCVAIFHCGAWVNTVLPYAPLAPANIDGTRTCLELALAAPQNRPGFHFISTLSVVGARDSPEEEAVLAPADCGTSGYAQTKWVADQLVVRTLMNPRERSSSTPTLFRYGNVSASNGGVCNVVDFQTRFMLGCLQLGSYPDASASMIYSPVDTVVAVTIDLAAQRQESPEDDVTEHVFHVLNPGESLTAASVGEFLAGADVPRPLSKSPASVWTGLLKSESGRGNALEPLLSYFDYGFPNDSQTPCERIMLFAPGQFAPVSADYFAKIVRWLRANSLA